MKNSIAKSFLITSSASTVGGFVYSSYTNWFDFWTRPSFSGYEIKMSSDSDLDHYLPYIRSEIDRNILENKSEIRNLKRSLLNTKNFFNRSNLSFENTLNLYKKPLSYYSSFYRFFSQERQLQKEFNRVARKIKFHEEKLKSFRNKIPYNVDEKKIRSVVEGLPESSFDKRYWVEIKKDNDKGEIELEVYGRALIRDDFLGNFDTYTNLLKSKKIKGFKKYPYKNILSERVVRIFNSSVNWLEEGIPKPQFYQYKNGFRPSWAVKELNFLKSGSGLVLDKEIGKPAYYIATNKHVVNSIIPTIVLNENKKYIYTNHYKLHKNKDLPPMHLSPVNAIFNWTNSPFFDRVNGNLKGYITFGGNKRLEGTLEKSEKFLDTIFEFKDKTKDIITSIRLVNDFTYPNLKKDSSTHSYNWSPNSSFFKLNSLDSTEWSPSIDQNGRLMDDLEKNSADLVILRVEFKDGLSDPFFSWWKDRPTRIRSLNEEDILNSMFIDNSVLSVRQEYGKKVRNEYWSAGYSSYKNGCDAARRRNPNKEISIKKAISDNNINRLYWTDYSKQNMIGRLRYPDGLGIQTKGSSGSPIFDRNGRVLGLLWSGSEERVDDCYERNPNLFNLFFWFSNNLGDSYLRQKNRVMNEFDDFSIPRYDFIRDKNNYSLYSQIRKEYPNTRTYLTKKLK